MIITFILIIGLMLVGVFWYQSAKIHELAVMQAKQFCKEHGLQLLDDTVALKKIRLIKDENGRRCFQRVYQMQYFNSPEQKKEIVFVVMNANRCKKIGLNEQSNNVINLTDYRK